MDTKWLDWITTQPADVQQEILRGIPATPSFKDFGDKGISLEELEELDNKYNLD